MVSIYDEGPFLPCPSPFNLAEHVLKSGAQIPDKTALILAGGQKEEHWSFGALIAAVRGTATGLLTRGAAPGDIVLMRLGNTVDFPICYLGALAAGLVPVPTSSALTETEVAKIIQQLKPKLVVKGDGVSCPDHDAILSEDELRAMRKLAPAPFHRADPERLGYIIYTSGTSGVPRAVCHAQRAIWARQMMIKDWYGLTPEDTVLHAGAFNWTYTLGTGLMDPWSVGATAIIPAPGTPAHELPGFLSEHRASIFASAPGVYRQMLKHHDKINLPYLRHGLSAGEKLSPSIYETWRTATGKPIYEAYGMSECSTFISSCPMMPGEITALGRPQKGRRVAILGPDGPVPHGAEGTIAISRKDPGLMLGYFGAPKATAERFSGDWFVTGDRGVMDENAQISYLGRDDDMMNAGGFRVSPLEIEHVLSEMPGVSAIGVTEVDVKKDVTVIAVFFVSQTSITDADWQAFAQPRLAAYKQPRAYIQMDALPTSGNGKLNRRALRAHFKDALR